MNRGDRREAIFEDDADREVFLVILGQACQKTDWQVHAWCLMGNHFHLAVETPKANLVAGMKWFLGDLHGQVQPAAQTGRLPLQSSCIGPGTDLRAYAEI
ncbi:MAG: transposase [Candidatus Omnitrophica bacterium]|nr:transposase [Candidatus Omnitrophota bacterium]